MATTSERSNRNEEERSGTHALSSTRGSAGQGEGDGERGVGRRIAKHARSYLTDELHDRRSRSSADFASLAKSLRLTSEQLENNLASPWLGMLASGLDRVAKLLEEGQVRDLSRAASDLARREPALFYAGMFAVGFGGARFFKSTASTGATQGRAKQARQP